MRCRLAFVVLLLAPGLAAAADGGAYITQIGAHGPAGGLPEVAAVPVPVPDKPARPAPERRASSTETVDPFGNALAWTHDGSELAFEVTQTGYGNSITARQGGTLQRMSISQSGNGNVVSASQAGSGNTVVVVQR